MALHHHDYFSDKSDLYASARPKYPGELFVFLSSLCRATESAWDCGTGSGQAAISVARFFTQVFATDVSAEQIKNATPDARVMYSIQPAEETDFDSDSFDLITAAQSLHWFEFDRFWPEVLRVLKPEGIFAAWGYSWPHISKDIDKVVEEYLMKPIEIYWAPQNRLIWDGYRDVEFPFEMLSAPNFTMAPVWNLDQLLSYLGTWSATRRCVEAQGDAFFATLESELLEVWGEPKQETPVTMDFHIKVGRRES